MRSIVVHLKVVRVVVALAGSLALATVTTGVSPVMAAAAPVSAAVSCPGGQTPLWWANVHASEERDTNMLLDVPNASTTAGTPLQLWQVRNTGPLPQALWCMERVNTGVYKFRNASTGKCMDIAGPSYGNGVVVNQGNCHSGSSQNWRQGGTGLEWVNGVHYRTYQFQNMYNGGCLDGKDWGIQNGTKLHMWSCGQTENQMFY